MRIPVEQVVELLLWRVDVDAFDVPHHRVAGEPDHGAEVAYLAIVARRVGQNFLAQEVGVVRGNVKWHVGSSRRVPGWVSWGGRHG